MNFILLEDFILLIYSLYLLMICSRFLFFVYLFSVSCMLLEIYSFLLGCPFLAYNGSLAYSASYDLFISVASVVITPFISEFHSLIVVKHT